ncbi:hypothetical protein ASPBRDRAFT_134355, partial [Aspergillus brasiliensis CBS 101740]
MLLELPVEVLQGIADWVPTAKALNNFAKSNTHLYQVVNPYLYRYDLEYCDGKTLTTAATLGQEARARLSLAAANKPSLRHIIQKALILAAQHGHKALVELLVSVEGIDPDLPDECKRAPLYYAAHEGHEAVLEMLLQLEVNPDREDGTMETPLGMAARRGNLGVMKLLLATKRLLTAGAKIKVQDDRGRTPLILAAGWGCTSEAVETLIAAGAEIHSQDNRGRTALIHAVRHNDLKAVKALITAGAKIDIQDNSGMTAL